MRDKYFVRLNVTEFVCGLRYDGKDGHTVLCGGPVRFDEGIKDVLRLLGGSRALSPKRISERTRAERRGRVKYILRGITQRRWENGLEALKKAGYTLQMTRGFRRLMG